MKPFILKQHEKDFAKVRELRTEELEQISGSADPRQIAHKLNTYTVTPDGDGGDDGADEG